MLTLHLVHDPANLRLGWRIDLDLDMYFYNYPTTICKRLTPNSDTLRLPSHHMLPVPIYANILPHALRRWYN